jgi:hypothetical protein
MSATWPGRRSMLRLGRMSPSEIRFPRLPWRALALPGGCPTVKAPSLDDGVGVWHPWDVWADEGTGSLHATNHLSRRTRRTVPPLGARPAGGLCLSRPSSRYATSYR